MPTLTAVEKLCAPESSSVVSLLLILSKNPMQTHQQTVQRVSKVYITKINIIRAL